MQTTTANTKPRVAWAGPLRVAWAGPPARAPLAGRRASAAAGFTLIELLVTLLVIAILIGLLLVGFNQFQRTARGTAMRQDVLAIKTAVEAFRQDFGFAPHLVKDGYDDVPRDRYGNVGPVGADDRGRLRPVVFDLGYGPDEDYHEEWRSKLGQPDYRFSVHSVPYYLVGVLGRDIDGVDGEGFRTPLRDGRFDRQAGARYGPMFDPGSAARVVSVDRAAGSTEPETEYAIELQDRNGVPIRYYRWWHDHESGEPGLPDQNVPMILGDPRYDDTANPNKPEEWPGYERPELRSAEYAIVAAGPNRVFGDIPVESREQIERRLGKTFRDDLQAEIEGRSDNIVEVGGRQ